MQEIKGQLTKIMQETDLKQKNDHINFSAWLPAQLMPEKFT